jgi:hypothetical protein
MITSGERSVRSNYSLTRPREVSKVETDFICLGGEVTSLGKE